MPETIKHKIPADEQKALMLYWVEESLENLSTLTNKQTSKADMMALMGVLKNNMLIVKETIKEL